MPYSLAPSARLQRNVGNCITLLRTQGDVRTTLSMASAVIHIFDAEPPLGDFPRLESRPQRRQSYDSNDLVKKAKGIRHLLFSGLKKAICFFQLWKKQKESVLAFFGLKKATCFFHLQKSKFHIPFAFFSLKRANEKIPTHVSMVGNLDWIVK